MTKDFVKERLGNPSQFISWPCIDTGLRIKKVKQSKDRKGQSYSLLKFLFLVDLMDKLALVFCKNVQYKSYNL